MSRPHRHIRIRNKLASQERIQTAMDNAANPEPKAMVGVRADGKAQSLGFRSSPDMKQAHRIRIHFSPMGGSANGNRSLTSRQLQAKHPGLSQYNENIQAFKQTPLETGEVLVRIGTIPSRLIEIKDKETGELRKVRTKPKPRWGSIGSPPKDAGK